jgi:hypothetical protein
MTKALLSKRDLEKAALVEIRSCYGCEDVRAVLIEQVEDLRPVTNWRICSIIRASGHVAKASPAELNGVTRAIESVHNRLRDIYELRTDFTIPRSDDVVQ